MSVVTAIVDDDGIGHMAADSQITNSNRSIIKEGCKIENVSIDVDGDEHALIGFSGKLRNGQLAVSKMRSRIKQNILSIRNNPTDSTIISNVADPVRKELDKKNASETKSGRDNGKASILLVVSGKIFKIGIDFSVIDYGEGPITIGCGRDLALGSIETARRHDYGDDATNLLRLATEAAIKNDVYCGFPITVMDTRGVKDIYRDHL